MPSNAFLESVIASQTDEAHIVLLTFTHPNLAQPIRVTNNTQDVVIGANTFIAFPFTLTPPTDGDGVGKAGISIANADRRIGEALEALLDPADVMIQLVLASSPSTIEFEWKSLNLIDVSWDGQFMQGTLSHDQFSREQYPYIRVTMGRFPSVFY